jgi:hypothetical protein
VLENFAPNTSKSNLLTPNFFRQNDSTMSSLQKDEVRRKLISEISSNSTHKVSTSGSRLTGSSNVTTLTFKVKTEKCQGL